MTIWFFRYENILPYDHSRIQLKDEIDIGEERCDYINASWITMTDEVQKMSNFSGKGKTIAPNGSCKDISFLASQGPTKLTNSHFLQMIYEQKADAIVMLTRLVQTDGQGMFSFKEDIFESVKLFNGYIEVNHFAYHILWK